MPKGSEELTNARKEEIINACASLYETMGFKDITIRDIGAKTSFTRTSIYNYFQTKEEIFLALLQREYEAWTLDLKTLLEGDDTLSLERFASELAHTLEPRECMLKLVSMNLYDMEGNSRMENLVAFKKVYAGSMEAVACCLEKFFPSMASEYIQVFLYDFSHSCSASILTRCRPKNSGKRWKPRRSIMPGIRFMSLQDPSFLNC